MEELAKSDVDELEVKGELDSRVYVPFTAFGEGYVPNKRSASYPTIPGTVSPSLNPVPAYTQFPLFFTTYVA
ncbi:MAG: hypothetical protein DMG76_31490 [Acidobacteria bacterium]|nr:MAG: hypothetical protein DMG76_31490 [Acidobacteriota bacterium]